VIVLSVDDQDFDRWSGDGGPGVRQRDGKREAGQASRAPVLISESARRLKIRTAKWQEANKFIKDAKLKRTGAREESTKADAKRGEIVFRVYVNQGQGKSRYSFGRATSARPPPMEQLAASWLHSGTS